MAVPKWQPGKLYPPGSLVVPRTELPSEPVALQNPGWETGDTTGWDVEIVKNLGTGFVGVRNKDPKDGLYIYALDGTSSSFDAEVRALNQEQPACAAGTLITARMWVRRSGGAGKKSSARVILRWYDALGDEISTTEGALHNSSEKWIQATASAVAPAGTASVRAGFWADAQGDGDIRLDSLSWNYDSDAPPPGLMYKAVQAETGYSATVEPAWPPVLGVQVIDNEVTWECVKASRVVWQAEAILKTGATEPTWPTVIGEAVADNTISWSASDPITTDENCPHTKIVCIAKFKVYAGDGDVVRYTATLGPQDWTTEKNAGYLGTGLQQNGANRVAVLNLYRADLSVMNATTFQRWQIDPDPALMDLIDTMDGIGSIYHLACVPVADDLFYLSNNGVRTIGVTGATKNLAAGDVGLPVDPIVKQLVADLKARNEIGDKEEPLGLYWPSSGQYWLSFNRVLSEDDFIPDESERGKPKVGTAGDLCPTLWAGDEYAEVMVYTLTQVGQVGAWSRYVFPFRIDDWTQEGDDLYVRDGDTVFRIGTDVGTCDRYNPIGTGEDPPAGQPFTALIQWPWLDAGAPAADKQMESFEVVGYGRGWFEFGYDQTEPGYFTDPYEVVPDTLRGTPVPMPLMAPSYSVRVRYHGWDPSDSSTFGQRDWSLNAISMQFT